MNVMHSTGPNSFSMAIVYLAAMAIVYLAAMAIAFAVALYIHRNKK